MLIKKLNNQFINCDIFYRLIKIFLLCLVGLNLFSINVSSKEQNRSGQNVVPIKVKLKHVKFFMKYI